MKRYIRCGISSQRAEKNPEQIAYELLATITRKLQEILQSPEFGFSAEEAKSYSHVDIYPPTEAGWCVEVRAEVTYDEFMDILPQLNPIVEEIDPDAYFDMEEPGVATSYVDIRNAIESSQDISDYKIEPPEPEYDYTEKDDIDDGILVHVVADVIVDSDGDFEYVDDRCLWAKNPSRADGDWYSVEHPEVKFADAFDVSEYVGDLLADKLPKVPGKYHVDGHAWLQFYIENVNEWRSTRKSRHEDDEPFIDWDDVEVRYEESKSGFEEDLNIQHVK